jgi:type III pantothenate kinase
MLLAVDVGNSRIKFALFEGDMLVNTANAQTTGFTSADCLRVVGGLAAGALAEGRTITHAGVSSVVPQMTLELLPALRTLSVAQPVVINAALEFGMAMDVENPHTLGPDRLSGAAAVFRYFGVAAAVVDFGTATTISAVDNRGRFIGGTIMPGIYSMLRCLKRDTALLGDATPIDAVAASRLDTVVAPQLDTVVASQLDTVAASRLDTVVAPQLDTVAASRLDTVAAPQLDAVAAPQLDAVAAPPPGRNTGSAMLCGVVYGTAGAVERIMAEMERSTGLSFKVAATGGAAPCVVPHLGRCDLHDPYLVLKGVRAILECAKYDIMVKRPTKEL